MIVFLAIGVGVLFGTGSALMLRRDLIRVVAGVIMISNAANLFLMAAAIFRGSAPIYPLPPATRISDPLVQALTLTAIVITFAFVALLLNLVYRVYTAYHSIDQRVLSEIEQQYEEAD